MSKDSQYALARYKAGREGTSVEYQAQVEMPKAKATPTVDLAKVSPDLLKFVRIGALLLVLVAVAIYAMPTKIVPVELTYELDLGEAHHGTLIVTLIAEGDLPKHLDLEFPPGVFGDEGNGVTPHAPTGPEIGEDGRLGKPLAVKRTPDGWQWSTRGGKRAGCS